MAIVVFALTIGLYAPLWLVLVLALMHRAQTWLFGGCVVSKLERGLGSFSEQTDFLRHAAQRLFGITMSAAQSKVVDYSLLATTLLVSFSKFLLDGGWVTLPELSLVFAASAGLGVSLYISKTSRTNALNVCAGKGSCNKVLASRYSSVAGIKLSDIGVVFYAICLAVLLVSFWQQFLNPLLVYLGMIGFFGSILLVYLQAFVIKAWCRLCLMSAGSATAFMSLVIVV